MTLDGSTRWILNWQGELLELRPESEFTRKPEEPHTRHGRNHTFRDVARIVNADSNENAADWACLAIPVGDMCEGSAIAFTAAALDRALPRLSMIRVFWTEACPYRI
jgi:hypothetical protein